MLKPTAILCSLVLSLAATELNKIESVGTRFYDTVTGKRFFIKGIAYQPRAKGLYDVLAVPADCQRDAKVIQELGLNAIRVYQTYPENDHKECMEAFASVGIYVAFDLPIPDHSIPRDAPSYRLDIYEHYKKKIDAFAHFSNTLMFFAGNEVTNNKDNTPASSYVKAALRDAKAYMKTKSRIIPIGYADNDDPAIRGNIQSFFNCGTDEEHADFYGLNVYSWCGKSSFKNSGYDKRTEELMNYDTPVILSEYGCEVLPRLFDDIVSLYNSDMNQVFSGGFIYEYSQEVNKFGLVEIRDGQIIRLDAFNAVKNHMANVKLPDEDKKSPIPASTRRQCPAISDTWKSSNILPPTPLKSTCDCVMHHLECTISETSGGAHHGEMGKLLDDLCQKGHCNDLSADQVNGKYGAYSFCPINVQASVALSSAVKQGTRKCEFLGLTTSAQRPPNANCANFQPTISTPSAPIVQPPTTPNTPTNPDTPTTDPPTTGETPATGDNPTTGDNPATPPKDPNSATTHSLTYLPLAVLLSLALVQS